MHANRRRRLGSRRVRGGIYFMNMYNNNVYTQNCGDYNDIWDAVVERMHRCAKAPLITGQQWARIIFLDNIIMKTTQATTSLRSNRIDNDGARKQGGWE